MIRGSIPALVTPFRDSVVDEPTLRALIEWQIQAGSHGLVPVGTTGESATLSHDEHQRVTEIAIEVAAGRVPVIAGCGSNSTQEAISLIRHAEKAGADAALVVCPYYNKPNQEGLYLHFKALAEASDLPILIYNIPGRSVVDMTPETMGRLAELKTIIGVKDATGNIARVSQQRITCGTDFIQLSGNDETALAFNASGGKGCISVAANVAPELCAKFQEATLAGDYATALALNDKLFPLHMALFSDASPGPTKYALWKLGRISSLEVRLPMTQPSEAARAKVDAALAHAGLL
ncbi:4-hydroxy-tetrahydrodipicolinate synthase [Pedomonas mirosovicensis]|uniref:4-hydroxy-tetrahydrodipicolinate synthase n=1 Tax=Pedomonas mirosovicensis TaxID=2908641 RepID=UPI002168AA17|nr:4-hydroxy-tetrahydrodipicolinate synthase [Pedomonas mirosovicensis]MCH8685904.1 4-hydroxy-tetrahydrodipicolinate synthase [Pedomonas mirosovicensis]